MAEFFIQKIESKDAYVHQYVNEAFEVKRNDKANPPIEPEIRLKEGWRNGNIKVSTAAPADSEDTHTWDIWLQVASTDSNTWETVTGIFVRVK